MLQINKVIQERFEKNGLLYDCIICPEDHQYDDYRIQFHVFLKIPQQSKNFRFKLLSTGDGHWQPDEKKYIDPWIADAIGRIILDNF